MNGWQKTIAPILLVTTGVIFLIMAVEEWAIDGGPIHYQWFGLAIMWFVIAFASFRRGRRSESGPPNT